MQMNDDYQKAINGTLQSHPIGTPSNLRFVNMTALVLVGYRVLGRPGERTETFGLPGTSQAGQAGGETTVRALEGEYWLVTSADTGAFVAVYATPTDGTSSIYITEWDLLEPNDIGKVPEPDIDGGLLLPADSPRIAVGCGLIPPAGGEAPTRVLREQYWQRLADSYSIAPGETMEYSYTVSSGKQETTSDLKTLETAVSASAGAGWGPVSASVSASLSTSSTTFQQITVTEQTTSYVSEKYSLDHDADKPEMMLNWQLADVVSMFAWDGGTPLGSIVTATQPTVVRGPYILPDPATAGTRSAGGAA
ncbi:hypothetical protein [Streptomyces sp. NBC_01268]|uniref:hypothetical protein n=1 Tax=unclassified Streptomyces TaxID=2593676 RepID=UPI002E34459F|nr:hypothetical protein [Streptomyces sp. NBC_01268]